tara:strand:+ start:1362 stop:2126 length:765 start_codon:yes stop_codon:yes gene_type:complete
MDKVQKILHELNLTDSIEFEDYIKKMESCIDGQIFMNLIDELDDIGSENVDWTKIYDAMSKNIKISQLITSYANSLIFKEVLQWFRNQNYSMKSFLELGCNNGLLSIAISKLLGNIQFFGIDYASNAILAAKLFAKKYKIKNSCFFYADINIDNSFKNIPKVDMIVAPFFFHEIILFQKTNWDAINKNINLVAKPHTILIAINRFEQVDSQCDKLSFNLLKSNFKEINRDSITVNSSSINNESEIFPVQVFSKI